MAVVFERPRSLLDIPTHYCPGCHHGIIHRLVAEVLDELKISENTILVAPVGCSTLSYNYFDLDAIESLHGRAPATATGIKRVHPDKLVFTYQGDGDYASIGTAESIHAAVRGENISTIFVNNAIYGMTGGQMAPTTLIGQVTNTSPYGRDAAAAGNPVKMSEIIATIEGAAFVARVAVNNPANMVKAKAAIKKAFTVQMQGQGYSLVECLSTCPTNWGMSPLESVEWLEQNMMAYYPLGVFKEPSQRQVLYYDT